MEHRRHVTTNGMTNSQRACSFARRCTASASHERSSSAKSIRQHTCPEPRRGKSIMQGSRTGELRTGTTVDSSFFALLDTPDARQ